MGIGCWHCRRIATRLNTPLQYLDGDCYEGMFHMSKMHRISLEQETKVLSECGSCCHPLTAMAPCQVQCIAGFRPRLAAANRIALRVAFALVNQLSPFAALRATLAFLTHL